MERADAISLSVAAAGHVLLVAVLSFGLFDAPKIEQRPPDVIDVSFADDIALKSGTPIPTPPAAGQAPAEGPVEDATPAPSARETVTPEPTPPVARPEPEPAPRPEPRAQPKPVPRPQPKPAPAPAPERKAPPPRAEPRKPAPPARAEADKPKAEAGEGKAQAARGSRLGPNFLQGVLGDRPAANSSPGPLSDAHVRALNQEISRQLKPFWRAPTGADADQLVTTLRWQLNADGTLKSGPELVSQDGRTASNQPQQQLHVEAAIRAVRAAAPFKLPPEYYDHWKNIVSFRFDRRL